MARIYRPKSEVQRHFEEMFDTMESKGIQMEAYGGDVQFYLSKKEFPLLSENDRHVQVVDLDTFEELTSFPPVCAFAVKVFNS